MSAGSAQGAGRFAPSPTGALHLGSLLAAVASYLDARQQGIAWRLRLDDLDTPRNEPGADAAILRSLEAHGLHWDGPVVRQSEGMSRYAAALEALADQGLVFYCRCSRRELRGRTRYPGTCRAHVRPREDSAIRVRTDEARVAFDDLLQGPQRYRLRDIGGDFVVRRRDGLFAYQLATAVDDGAAGITRVIRGRDLLTTTPRQVYLMERLAEPLALTVPVYGHIRLLLNGAGDKLSKQNQAAPLDDSRAPGNLATVLGLLGLEVDSVGGDCPSLLAAAATRFSLPGLPREDAVL